MRFEGYVSLWMVSNVAMLAVETLYHLNSIKKGTRNILVTRGHAFIRFLTYLIWTLVSALVWIVSVPMPRM